MSEAFDGVLPTGMATVRPRSQGARRRALPPEEMHRAAFGTMPTPSKTKSKTVASKLPPASTRREPPLFPALTVRQRPEAIATHRADTGGEMLERTILPPDLRDEDSGSRAALRDRLHASGIRRSHAQTNVVRAAPPPAGNQADDTRLDQPRRPARPIAHDNKPLVSPTSLHPSSNGVLIPTRPLTSSSTARPTSRGAHLQVPESKIAETGTVTKKVPLTARDKYYLEQRAATAPTWPVGQSPRTARPRSGIETDQSNAHVHPPSQNQSAPKPRNDVPQRAEILSRCDGFKTFTETIVDDLRRASSSKQEVSSARAAREMTLQPISAAVAPDSFFYLRRVDSNPYHLAVAKHASINPDDYYTASRLGITHFAHNSSEFVALEKFEREHYIYSLMVKLPFFRKYRLWKRFTLWKQEINDRKQTMATLSLNQNLFVLLPHLHEALMQLRALCVSLCRIRLFEFGDMGSERSLSAMNSTHQAKTYTLGEFSIRLKAQKMECERQVDRFVAEAAMIAKGACEKYLYAFLEETGFNEELKHTALKTTKAGFSFADPESKPASKPKSVTEAILTSTEMTYTERANMRTQCRKITKFLRVVDYLVLDALLQVAILSTEALVQEMRRIKEDQLQVVAPNTAAMSASQAAVNAAIMARYKHSPLLKVEVMMRGDATTSSPPIISTLLGQTPSRPRLLRRLSSSSLLNVEKQQTLPRQPSQLAMSEDQHVDIILFKPHEEQLRSQLETLVFNGLKAVTSRDRLLSNTMFRIYLDAGMDEGVGEDDGDDDGENGDFSAEGLDLDILIMEDSCFVSAMQGLNAVVQEAFRRADAQCTSFTPFLTKYHANKAFCARVVDPSFLYAVQVDELRDLLEMYTNEIKQFDALPESSVCGLLLLDNTKLNGQLKPSPRKCMEQLHFLVPLVIQYKNAKMMDELTRYNDTISAIPASVDEYAETLAFLRHLQSQVETVEEEYLVLKSLYQLVEEYRITISDADQTNAFLLSQRRAQLRTSMELFENSCEQYTEKFGIELEARIPALVSQLTQVKDALSNQKLFGLDSDPQDVVDYLGGVEILLQGLEAAVERHCFFESTLSLPHTTAFEELGEVKQDLVIKADLWNAMLMWNVLTNQWEILQFPSEVHVEAITSEITVIYNRILQWESQLPVGTGVLCTHLKLKVDDYRITMPILHDLQCPSFEERHYTELQSLLGFAVTSVSTLSSISNSTHFDRSLTIGELIAMKIGPFAQQVNRIANDAAQERLLKENLEKIIAVWERTEFEVRSYKDSKDYAVISSYELIYATLEESLVNLTTLLNSKHLAPIKDIAIIWQRRLALFQDTLDAWVECQRKWMHLETIFSAPDIQKQLPNESLMFVTVNQFWKDIMRKAKDHRNCLKVCGALSPTGSNIASLLGHTNLVVGNSLQTATPPNPHANQISLLESFNRHNASLDKIEKSLEDYLETNRGFFPGFHFISNDELLEMLAHAKEPQSVQRHLCKCFDALIKLELREEVGPALNSAYGQTAEASAAPTTSSAPDILAMISPEGERVAFSRALKARGNVEDWLNAVLSNMKVTLQRHMKSSVLDYQHASRETWLFRHPAQCIAVVSYIIWARECESCFLSSTNDPIKEMSVWHQTICTQLSNLTRLVRTSLSTVQRCLVVSLITTDVHFRDVVEDLISKQVTSPTDFM